MTFGRFPARNQSNLSTVTVRNNNINNNNRGSSGGGMDRIAEAVQSMRREKDDTSRQRAVANQSLRLVREEIASFKKTLHALQEECRGLEIQVSGDVERKIQALQHDVEKLQQEVSAFLRTRVLVFGTASILYLFHRLYCCSSPLTI